MDIHTLIQTTYEGKKDLASGAGALSLYFTSADIARVIPIDEAVQLTAIIISYLFKTAKNPSLIERIELRVHAKSIIKKLAGIAWYKRFNLQAWLDTYNWTAPNIIPHTLLGLLIEPSFWLTHIKIIKLEGKTPTYSLSLAKLETCLTEDAVEIPEL